MMSARDKLLEAARDVFAQHGYVGSTTRRIAEAAGVNEVTVFRLFGSKEALLDEAVRLHTTGEHAVPLPDEPDQALDELAAWCAAEIDRLAASRTLILKCFAEEPTHPGFTAVGSSPLAASALELNRYVDRLLATRHAKYPEARAAASTMLLATLYSDALGRTTLPIVHSIDREEAPAQYARIFLRALGVTD